MDYESGNSPFNYPTYTIKLQEKGPVLAVHYSSYEWSQNIMLVAFANKILVAQITHDDKLELETVTEIQHEIRCTSLCLSSETATNIVPVNVQFCTAGNDFNVRVFKSNLDDENTCQLMSGHSGYINDINYDPENQYIASVSDDHTANIWSTQDHKLCTTFRLTSPGMSCCWHREDPSKLLVAEKVGVIRFYNVVAEKPILSCSYTKSLSSAHWSPSDAQLVASLNMGEVSFWDTIHSSRPVRSHLVYTEPGGEVKFNQTGEFLAVVNNLENSVKVLHVQTQQERLNGKVVSPSNLTWHFRSPLLCIGDDRKLCFWKISGK